MGILYLVLWLIILAFSIIAHEYAHGKAADLFGDNTARILGRLSFNPIVHVDLLGTIVLPAFFILSGSPMIFGWAKPVPINPNNFKDPDKDMAVVSLAGPLTNFFLAWAIAVLIRFVLVPAGVGQDIIMLFYRAIYLNVILAVINLIPIPPLDGSRLLRAVVPQDWAHAMDGMEKFGFIIILFVLFFPGVSDLIFSLVQLIVSLLI